MTLIYSNSDNGAAQHFSGTGTVQAVDVETADGRQIQFTIQFTLEV